jgi:hypothetical protein
LATIISQILYKHHPINHIHQRLHLSHKHSPPPIFLTPHPLLFMS